MMGSCKSAELVEEMIAIASQTGLLKAISLTSGVEVDPESEVGRISEIVRRLRSFAVPIGVSVCPTKDSSRMLKDAGAVEVKYNVETVDPDLFDVVCPGLDLDEIMSSLDKAVGIFGLSHVFTNVIIGLGESDKVMMAGIDRLAEMGVMPVLRPVYPHPLRVDDLEMTRPDAARLLRLARHAKKAMDMHGLRGDEALTMCYPCTGCDLTPHRDV
jgi:biotin synthase-related radical SAM superfamily protein